MNVLHWKDCEDKKEMLASLVQILMAEGEVIKPTSFYKTAFIRDGGMITHVLNLAGFFGQNLNDFAVQVFFQRNERGWRSYDVIN